MAKFRKLNTERSEPPERIRVDLDPEDEPFLGPEQGGASGAGEAAAPTPGAECSCVLPEAGAAAAAPTPAEGAPGEAAAPTPGTPSVLFFGEAAPSSPRRGDSGGLAGGAGVSSATATAEPQSPQCAPTEAEDSSDADADADAGAAGPQTIHIQRTQLLGVDACLFASWGCEHPALWLVEPVASVRSWYLCDTHDALYGDLVQHIERTEAPRLIAAFHVAPAASLRRALQIFATERVKPIPHWDIA